MLMPFLGTTIYLSASRYILFYPVNQAFTPKPQKPDNDRYATILLCCGPYEAHPKAQKE
jgi:hypothetical protein